MDHVRNPCMSCNLEDTWHSKKDIFMNKKNAFHNKYIQLNEQ